MPPHPARPLLLLDYDGTLAPIVADPAAAGPHPDVPGLLAHLAARHLVVVVTGRDVVALGRLLVGEDGTALPLRAVGLHGAEWGVLGDVRHEAREHAEAFAAMRASVPTHAGLVVEDKGAAFAVHYRHAPDADAAREALDAWTMRAPDALEPVAGQFVVQLRARGLSRGTAVRRLAAEHAGCTPVMIGDDVTDEDTFRALGLDAVTVKVGPGETAARHRLPDVEAVVDYLRGFDV